MIIAAVPLAIPTRRPAFAIGSLRPIALFLTIGPLSTTLAALALLALLALAAAAARPGATLLAFAVGRGWGRPFGGCTNRRFDRSGGGTFACRLLVRLCSGASLWAAATFAIARPTLARRPAGTPDLDHLRLSRGG